MRQDVPAAIQSVAVPATGKMKRMKGFSAVGVINGRTFIMSQLTRCRGRLAVSSIARSAYV